MNQVFYLQSGPLYLNMLWMWSLLKYNCSLPCSSHFYWAWHSLMWCLIEALFDTTMANYERALQRQLTDVYVCRTQIKLYMAKMFIYSNLRLILCTTILSHNIFQQNQLFRWVCCTPSLCVFQPSPNQPQAELKVGCISKQELITKSTSVSSCHLSSLISPTLIYHNYLSPSSYPCPSHMDVCVLTPSLNPRMPHLPHQTRWCMQLSMNPPSLPSSICPWI